MKRRNFLKNTTLATDVLATGLPMACNNTVEKELEEAPIVAQAITSGTKQHWFGYYDKWQISWSWSAQTVKP